MYASGDLVCQGIGVSVIGAMMLSLVWQFISRLRDKSRIDPNVCEECGYDLRATPQRCPECGTVNKRDETPTGRVADEVY
jgi:tRNA(Ile2) C34 agmatinyltransferase TiaS